MKTKLILIALALLLVLGVAPVAAMWENSNWIPEDAHVGYTVVYNAASDVTSKYKETSPFDGVQEVDKAAGTLQCHVKSGFNTLTSQYGVRNVLDGANGTFTMYPILPDGWCKEEQFAPGRFELCLFNDKDEQDGNGGQPECAYFNIVAGRPSQPERELIGHTVSQSPAPLTVSAPTPDCHEHRIWIFGHFEYFESHPHWRWINGHWFTWTCCKQHCHDYDIN